MRWQVNHSFVKFSVFHKDIGLNPEKQNACSLRIQMPHELRVLVSLTIEDNICFCSYIMVFFISDTVNDHNIYKKNWSFIEFYSFHLTLFVFVHIPRNRQGKPKLS